VGVSPAGGGDGLAGLWSGESSLAFLPLAGGIKGGAEGGGVGGSGLPQRGQWRAKGLAVAPQAGQIVPDGGAGGGEATGACRG